MISTINMNQSEARVNYSPPLSARSMSLDAASVVEQYNVVISPKVPIVLLKKGPSYAFTHVCLQNLIYKGK